MKTFKTAKRCAEENTDTAQQNQAGQSDAPYRVFETEEEFIAAAKEALGDSVPQGGTMTQGGAMTQNGTMTQGGAVTEPASGGTDNAARLARMWEEDAAKLSAALPDFDFAAALRNDAFKDALLKTGSVFKAYAAMVRPPYQTARGDIAQNALSPRRGTGESSVNPAKLSSEDFKRYIDNIRNR